MLTQKHVSTSSPLLSFLLLLSMLLLLLLLLLLLSVVRTVLDFSGVENDPKKIIKKRKKKNVDPDVGGRCSSSFWFRQVLFLYFLQFFLVTWRARPLDFFGNTTPTCFIGSLKKKNLSILICRTFAFRKWSDPFSFVLVFFVFQVKENEAIRKTCRKWKLFFGCFVLFVLFSVGNIFLNETNGDRRDHSSH